MDHYKITGQSICPELIEGKLDFNGKIEISENGHFEGKLIYSSKILPEQRIKGYVLRERNLELLTFQEFPGGVVASNLVYGLSKPQTGDIEGTYKGIWKALLDIVLFEHNQTFATFSKKANNPLKYQSNVDLSSNNAEITLQKI